MRKNLNRMGEKYEDMALSDFIGALSFGIMATSAVFLPNMVTPYLIGSFMMSFFIKWLFEKIWKFILNFRLAGFYFICFLSGVFVVIGLKIVSLPYANMWLWINGFLWVIMALMLVKNFGDRVLWLDLKI